MSGLDFNAPHPDPSELRALAAAASRGEPGWRDRVNSLPSSVLTHETLTSEPEIIAQRLRNIAVYVERRRNGAPFAKKAGEPLYESWLTDQE